MEEDNILDAEFDFGLEAVQHLYLSRNTRRLMEVINNRFAIIYTRKNVDSSGKIPPKMEDHGSIEDEDDCGQEVKWFVESKITRWPSNLTDGTSVPFIFS